MWEILGLGTGGDEKPPDSSKPMLAVSKRIIERGVVYGDLIPVKFVIPESFSAQVEARKLWIGN